MGAGNYDSRLERLTFTPAAASSTGQRVPNWVPSDTFLWCSVDETNGRRSQNYGATETGSDVEIKVRNFPTLKVNDVLEDIEGTKFVIDQLRNGDNELICDCHRYDELDPTGLG